MGYRNRESIVGWASLLRSNLRWHYLQTTLNHRKHKCPTRLRQWKSTTNENKIAKQALMFLDIKR